jgi:hypothetical protein
MQALFVRAAGRPLFMCLRPPFPSPEPGLGVSHFLQENPAWGGAQVTPPGSGRGALPGPPRHPGGRRRRPGDDRGQRRQRRRPHLAAGPPSGRGPAKPHHHWWSAWRMCQCSCPGAEVGLVPLVGQAVLARVLTHRRHRNAVAQGDAAKGVRVEETRHGRVPAPFTTKAQRPQRCHQEDSNSRTQPGTTPRAQLSFGLLCEVFVSFVPLW